MWRGLAAALLVVAVGTAQAAEYDLVLNHTDSPDPVIAGANVTYTLRVTNDSYANAVSNIQLSVTLPAAGVPAAGYVVGTYVSNAFSRGSCAPNPGNTQVLCDLGTLAPQAEATVTVEVKSSGQGIMRNQASVTSTTPGFVDPNTGNNSNFQDTTVKQGADVYLRTSGPNSLTSSVANPQAGQSLNYSLQVFNDGPDIASSVRATLQVPAAAFTVTSLPGICGQATASGTTTVTCNLSGTLGVGANTSIGPITGVVTASSPSTLTANAEVLISSASAPQDPDTTNNATSLDLTVSNGSDVYIAKTQSQANNITTGTSFFYTLTPRYTGDVPSGVRVTDSVPVGITVTSVTPSDGNWDCIASAGQSVDCSRNTTGLVAGYQQSTAMGSIRVDVTADVAGGYTNTANVSSTTPSDPVPGNNSASIATTIVPAEANLSANKTAYRDDGATLLVPALVVTNQPFKWRLSITNAGPSPFTGQLTLTDTLPANVQVNAYSNQTAGYWTCTLPLPINGPATITCNSAAGVTLGVGATSPYVDLDVEATAAGVALSNQACSTNSTPTGPADLTGVNDCQTSVVNSGADATPADIEIIKTDSPDPVTAGDVLTYTLKIKNNTVGVTANDVRVRDTIGNLINSTVHATTGGVVAAPSITTVGVSTGGTCAASAPSGTKSYVLSCDFATLPYCDDTPGNICPIITVDVRPNGTTPRGNTATAYSYQTPDGTLGNNTSTVSTVVTQRTDVTVSLSSTPASVRVGESVRYTANATNRGVSAAENATVTVTLPEGMVFVSASHSAGTGCSTVPGVSGTVTDATHKTVICNLGTLALPEPGNTTTQNVQIVARATLNTGSGTFDRTINTTASVSTSTPETDGTNNGNNVNTTVTQPQQDLQIQIDDLKDPAPAIGAYNPALTGYNVTYRVTVTNNGPSYASNVAVTHVLPGSGIAFTSATPSAGTCAGAAGGTLTCNLLDMTSGTVKTIDVVLQGTAVGIVDHSVSVTSDELNANTVYDPLPGNNSDVEDTTFKYPADLSLTKTVDRSRANNAAPGNQVKFTLTVRNDGPAHATDVSVRDYMPAQFTYVSDDGGGAYVSGTGIWTVGGLNVGQSKRLVITAIITPATPDGTYYNYAQVTTSSLPDPDSTPNNCASCVPAEDDEARVAVIVPAGPTGSLAGKVYQDLDDDGVVDLGEAGIAGVTVTLLDVGGATVSTAITDANGDYLFGGVLAAGTYTIRETHPVAWLDGKETVGIGASVAAGTAANAGYDATPANNQITGIQINPGDVATGYNFGERSYGSGVTASVSGRAWYNTRTIDKRQEPGEPNASSFVVELMRNGALVDRKTTDAVGAYRFPNVTPGDGYEIIFRSPHPNPASATLEHPKYGVPISQDPGYNASTPDYSNHTIANLVLRAGVELTEQNLPIDPSGIIYDAVTRQPVAGATVTISCPTCAPAFIPASHLVGGLTNVNQKTDASGFYQFLLLSGAPAGDYVIQVSHPNYVATPSLLIPPCSGSLVVGALPNPANIQANAYPPPIGTTDHRTLPTACPGNTSGLTPLNQATTQYYFTFTLSGASGNVLNNHIPLDPAPLGGGPLVVLKSTPLVNVSRGDLVPYTVTAININAAAQNNMTVRDVLPPGFKYKVGSGSVDGVPLEPTVNGRELLWTGQNFAAANAAGSRHVYRLIAVIGSGVGEGEYVNAARVTDPPGNPRSNTATATVRIVPDPTFDCSDVIGKVFDDRNANGWQDEGEPGLPNVRVATARGLLVTSDKDGRFHVPCAAIPQAQRGSNFFMKLDERTLPSGYRLTTENPREVRVTRGKLVKLNFGATIHRVIRLELSDAAFIAGRAEPVAALVAAVNGLQETLRGKPSVLRLAYQAGGEGGDLAKERLRALRLRIEEQWKARGDGYTLVFEEEIFERAAAKKEGAK